MSSQLLIPEIVRAIGLDPQTCQVSAAEFTFGMLYKVVSNLVLWGEQVPFNDKIDLIPAFKGAWILHDKKRDQAFIGSKSKVEDFAAFLEDEQFGDSTYFYHSGCIREDGLFTLMDTRDLLVNGLYIVQEYGTNIKVYSSEYSNDMFVHIKNIIPNSTHIVHFENKQNHSLFTDFMNRYSYVNS